jgi:hypothetical protein
MRALREVTEAKEITLRHKKEIHGQGSPRGPSHFSSILSSGSIFSSLVLEKQFDFSAE